MCEKLCVFCWHFDLSTGSADTFTEYSGNMSCDKGHFEYNGGMFGRATESELRQNIHRAKECKDYHCSGEHNECNKSTFVSV